MNNKSYLSPISFGRPDPIEEFAQKLKQSGNREEYQMARKLEAKMRTFAPVIVRGEETQGVRFWGFGKTVYQELLSVIADPDYGDINLKENNQDKAGSCTSQHKLYIFYWILVFDRQFYRLMIKFSDHS